MPGDLGTPATVLLLMTAVVAVVGLGWRVILRRRAMRRIARWTREFIDPMRPLAEPTEPVASGHSTSRNTGSLDARHPEHG